MKVERVRQRRRGLKGVRAAVAARTVARQPSNASAAWVTRERRDFVYDDWNQVHETGTVVAAYLSPKQIVKSKCQWHCKNDLKMPWRM